MNLEKREIPEPGEIYKHFKGGKYIIIAVSRDCDDAENPKGRLVIYQQIYRGKNYPEGTIWHKSLDKFCEYKIFKKDISYGDIKYKAEQKVKKFTLLGKLA